MLVISSGRKTRSKSYLIDLRKFDWCEILNFSQDQNASRNIQATKPTIEFIFGVAANKGKLSLFQSAI